ncbi:hypothetical protein GCM10017624_21740 [Azotobacter vinelandii]|nr:hypothetical protein GCM10017624_21740 [Azotobacter vinelandii]SFX81228.1 hypothetical protein SAMN04244547_02840 [Azotobacter vinelandii]
MPLAPPCNRMKRPTDRIGSWCMKKRPDGAKVRTGVGGSNPPAKAKRPVPGPPPEGTSGAARVRLRTAG